MTRSCFAAALAVLLLVALDPRPASAKTFQLGGKNPVAKVEFPDSWEPEEITFGVEAFSPDDSVYLSVEVADYGNIEDVTAESDKFLEKKGIVLKPGGPESVDIVANGMPVTVMRWDAKRKNEAMQVELALYKVSDKHTLITQNFGTVAGMAKYEVTLTEILDSIRPLRQ